MLKDKVTFVGDDKSAVMTIQKVASRSMLKTLKTRPELDSNGFPVVPTIAFIRDPIDRVVSAFKMFANLGEKQLFPKSWPDFVDTVLSGHSDPHIIPQARFAEIGELTLYPFERLSEVWLGLGFPKLLHLNRSEGAYIFPYRTDELLQHYAEDFEIRKWLL